MIEREDESTTRGEEKGRAIGVGETVRGKEGWEKGTG